MLAAIIVTLKAVVTSHIAVAVTVAVTGSLGLVYVAANRNEAQPSAEAPQFKPQAQNGYLKLPDETEPDNRAADKPATTAIQPTKATGNTVKPTDIPAKAKNPSLVPNLAPPVSPTPTPAGMPHITRVGTKLMRNGTQYKFAGINADTWFGCWNNEAAATNEANLQRYFGELNRNSMTRIWPYANTNWQATMDMIVRIAEQHGQYLMVTLSDANDNGTQCGSNKGSSYPADGGAVKLHAQQIVDRYKTSPAVAVWEICNECSRSASNKPWYVSIAQAIKAIDSTTLVASGAGTCYQTAWQNCVAVDDFPENDLVSIHEYDYNNGGVSHWTDETQNIAAQIGKPWFSGESGFTGGGRPTGLTTANFGQHLTTEWNAYLNANGGSGMLYWDMKWTYDFEDTINVGGRGWDAAKNFTHAWQGV